MKMENLGISGLMLLTPIAHADERGYFSELFNQRKFEADVCKTSFVQDNYSRSKGAVLRGLHYQLEPCAQGKLIRCVRGAIFDVAVDLRKSSPTFGRWKGVELSEENRCALWIPPGFAHGFATLTDLTDVLYKTSAYYSREYERTVRWDDSELKITWPRRDDLVVSDKDRQGTPFHLADHYE